MPTANHPVRQSVRLPHYDYAQCGAYFVTICTHERRPLFGDISDGIMVLNSNGEIARSCWQAISDHFPDTELPASVIMPNHLHGIIVIKVPVAARHAVPRDSSQSSQSSETFGKPVAGSLPTTIRSFKSAVTRQANRDRREGRLVIWQRGYYEHVIRSERELVQIGDYVLGNPMKWGMDRENPYCLEMVKLLPFEY